MRNAILGVVTLVAVSAAPRRVPAPALLAANPNTTATLLARVPVRVE